ncbi:unnamed protein product, partial [Oppiella nova]
PETILLKYQRFDPNSYTLTVSDGNAGIDLIATTEETLLPYSSKTIYTNIRVQLARGYFGKIYGRSSLAHMYSIIAFCGVIDNSYRGNIFVILFNMGNKKFTVKPVSCQKLTVVIVDSD